MKKDPTYKMGLFSFKDPFYNEGGIRYELSPNFPHISLIHISYGGNLQGCFIY